MSLRLAGAKVDSLGEIMEMIRRRRVADAFETRTLRSWIIGQSGRVFLEA